MGSFLAQLQGHSQNRVRSPILNSYVTSRQDLEGGCLAEKFQVGDRDLALLVASLTNEPVRVHARQAVDSDELWGAERELVPWKWVGCPRTKHV